MTPSCVYDWHVIRDLEILYDNGTSLNNRSVHERGAKSNHGDITVCTESVIAGLIEPCFCVGDNTSSVAIAGASSEAALGNIEKQSDILIVFSSSL